MTQSLSLAFFLLLPGWSLAQHGGHGSPSPYSGQETRAMLRYIHLSAHLDTIAIVSEEQVARYNALRGYGLNPCSNVPAGHDPAMWRKYNGCE